MSEDSNVERWDGLRLWVYRTRGAYMPAAVIMRYSRGGRQDDVLLGRSAVPVSQQKLALGDPYAALLAGLIQLRSAVIVQTQMEALLRASAAASPLGDHGGTEPLLDTGGNLRNAADPPQGKEPERSEDGS